MSLRKIVKLFHSWSRDKYFWIKQQIFGILSHLASMTRKNGIFRTDRETSLESDVLYQFRDYALHQKLVFLELKNKKKQELIASYNI